MLGFLARRQSPTGTASWRAWRTWARERTSPATRASLRRLQQRGPALLRLLRRGAGIADLRWMAHALRDHECSAGSRTVLLLAVTGEARALLPHVAAWRADDARGAAFAALVLDGCRRLDDGTLRRRGERLRSYVDVSVQADVLRALAGFLA